MDNNNIREIDPPIILGILIFLYKNSVTGLTIQAKKYAKIKGSIRGNIKRKPK
jgi:hypothetical protein